MRVHTPGRGVAAGGWWFAWRHHSQPPRPRYLFINETGQHDYDLAFRMSLKLAEKKSGIENALVLLASLPASKTIEQTAVELFTQKRIGARSNGRGILYLYSARENLLKIEVSYALEGDIPDVYCHRPEEAARSYMLSEIPQDFISELIITTNLRGVGATRGSTHWSSPQWLTSDFLSGGAWLADRLRHLVLPLTTLTLIGIGGAARFVRGAMLDVVGQPFVRTALAKGLAPFRVAQRHVARNALIPVVVLLGLSVPTLFSGAVFVEFVFAWPGVGRRLVEAVLARDYPVVMAATAVSAILVVVGNLVADALVGWIDPRIRHQTEAM